MDDSLNEWGWGGGILDVMHGRSRTTVLICCLPYGRNLTTGGTWHYTSKHASNQPMQFLRVPALIAAKACLATSIFALCALTGVLVWAGSGDVGSSASAAGAGASTAFFTGVFFLGVALAFLAEAGFPGGFPLDFCRFFFFGVSSTTPC